MSTDYFVACFDCKEVMPEIFASASISYGYKVWDLSRLALFLGDGNSIGSHEGHDVRIISEHHNLLWEDE